MKNFKLIIGLGNDDPQYANTYHNAGHLFIDYLMEHYPALPARKTSGYMNESGASVRAAMKKTSASSEHTLIVHDESDLLTGEYKISSARGAAGHKGVQSIFDVTGASDFTRLRIGIRPPAADQRGTNADLADALPRQSTPRAKAETFVLKKISSADKKILTGVFEKSARELFGEP